MAEAMNYHNAQQDYQCEAYWGDTCRLTLDAPLAGVDAGGAALGPGDAMTGVLQPHYSTIYHYV